MATRWVRGALILLCALAGIAAHWGSSNAQGCPTDALGFHYCCVPQQQLEVSVSGPALDTSFCVGTIIGGVCSGPAYLGRINYDWRRGTFFVSTLLQYGSDADAILNASDDFVVRGLSGPTTVTASLAVHYGFGGQANPEGCSAGTITGVLSSSIGLSVSDSRYSACEGSATDMLLQTGLSVVPDATFRLGLNLRSWVRSDSFFAPWAKGESLATLSFPDLPPGATVRSCKGYPDAVTGVTRATWAQVKAHYR